MTTLAQPARHPALTAPARSGAATDAAPAAGLALALHAALLSQPTAAAAAQALVITLARQLRFSRVGLAWAHGQQLQLLARSDGLAFADAAATEDLQRLMLAAAAESFDQGAAIVWPTPPAAEPHAPGDAPRITRALATLVRESVRESVRDGRPGTAAGASTASRAQPQTPAASAACVPLVVDGQRVGALCLQRHTGAAISRGELQQLEHLACLTAPLLWLMKRNERGALQRSRDALRQRWAQAGSTRRAQLQGLAALAAAGLLLVGLLPWPAQVGGRARLEGAVQRVLAAPVDGYVQQVHARAGDSVRAGQPLLELADQDLQLERQRWQSQLAQHMDALATAQARADRTQLVLQQNRADEAQAQLALTDAKLQRSRLVAPFDAVVVQGDWSQQLGAPVKEGTELLTLAPLDRYRVIVDIDERDISAVRAQAAGSAQKQPVQGTLMLSALPWDTLALRVTRVSPLAKAVEGRNVFEVEAELQAVSTPLLSGLRPGLQGTARLDAGNSSPLLHLMRRGLGAARVAWWEWLG